MPEEKNPYANCESMQLLTRIQRLENHIILCERILNNPINSNFYRNNSVTISKMRVAIMEMREEFFKEKNGAGSHADYMSIKLAQELMAKIMDKNFKKSEMP